MLQSGSIVGTFDHAQLAPGNGPSTLLLRGKAGRRTESLAMEMRITYRPPWWDAHYRASRAFTMAGRYYLSSAHMYVHLLDVSVAVVEPVEDVLTSSASVDSGLEGEGD
jgi:hypothetical protein